jgi:hypothetical protein
MSLVLVAWWPGAEDLTESYTGGVEFLNVVQKLGEFRTRD